jgi:23S rRNA pseudouridine1911/1915/1917 synthase
MTASALAWTAGAEQAGARLDVALASRPEVGTRAVAQRLIDSGEVLVDGSPRPKSHRLAVGERVEIRPAAPRSVPERDDAPHSVVHEDPWLLVVDKPAGVVVHPAPGHAAGTLAQALAGRAAGGLDPERAGIVHRLDRDTSGLLVVAKDPESHAALGAAIRAREVEREYLALVRGRPGSDRGTVDAPLGRDRSRRTLVSTRTDRPREARTHFETLEPLARTTLLRVRLETGRTHQIRAHMTAIGHPVCGDRPYGGGACGERLGLRRQFLHAHRLAFAHPVTGEPLDLTSPLPDDLQSALEAARSE